MKRRNFLIGGIAASAAVRAWPFRVYSLPSQIIAVDYLAEKEKYIRLARIHIDLQVANLGFFDQRAAGRWFAQRQKRLHHETPQLPLRLDGCACSPENSIPCFVPEPSR